MLGNLLSNDFFKNNLFSDKKKFLQEHRVSKGVNLDQDLCSVGLDLGPYFYKGYQQTIKVDASIRKELLTNNVIFFYIWGP